MPVLRSHGTDLAYRMANWGTEDLIPIAGSGYLSSSGEPVTAPSVYGLPAAMQAIRMPATLMASFELAVWEGVKADKKRVTNAQSRLLEQPTLDMSVFDWVCDMESALEGFNNAFALKVKDSRGRLVALEPIHPSFVQVRREDGLKVFDISVDGRWRTGLTPADVWHVRGFTVGPGVAAPSPVWVHRNPLGVALAQEQFVGDHFRNDARPGTILKFQSGTTEQIQQWVDDWDARHARSQNRGRTAGVVGAEVQLMPVSLVDAQFLESRTFSIEEIARIYDWPAWALDKTEESESQHTVEQRTAQLLSLYLARRMRRFEMALKYDPDIFGGTDSYPEFNTEGFVRVDARTLAEVEHKAVQAGTLLRDEVRADHGRPPLPGGAGQVVPATPVGATSQVAPDEQPAPEADN